MRSDACFIVFQFHPVSMCVSASLRGGIAHERLGNWDSKHDSWFCFIFFWCCDQGWIVQASEGYLKQRLQAPGCKRFQCFSVIQRVFFEDAGCIDRCGIGSHGHPKTSDSTWHLFPDMVEQHCPKFVLRCDPRWSQSCNLHSMWGKSRRA